MLTDEPKIFEHLMNVWRVRDRRMRREPAMERNMNLLIATEMKKKTGMRWEMHVLLLEMR